MIVFLTLYRSGIRSLFIWHTICMAIAIGICIPIARIQLIGNAQRESHILYSTVALCLLSIGWISVISNNYLKSYPVSALLSEMPNGKAIHVYSGYCMLIAASYQGLSGYMRLSGRYKFAKIHNFIGSFAPYLGLFVLFTTVLFWKGYWNAYMKIAASLLLSGIVFLLGSSISQSNSSSSLPIGE